MTPRTPYSDDERIAALALRGCTFPLGSWDKRFVRSLHSEALTERERPQLWRLFIRYRRQIDCPRKAELLQAAERLAAPDFRKVARMGNDQARVDELKRKYAEAMQHG
ncbi:MAG: hypothetical protein ABFD89_06800 [Bryobacteraceae bacterium]